MAEDTPTPLKPVESPKEPAPTNKPAAAPAAPEAKPAPVQPAAQAAGKAPAADSADQEPSEPVSNLMKGVFSNQSVIKVGTGTTTRKTIQKTFWYVEETKESFYCIQVLNAAYVPTGPTKTISKDDLLANYLPEPEMYQQVVFPRMRDMTKTVARAERHRKRGELFSAEYEFNNVLKVDEQNVRANFGLGLTYLERAEMDKANDLFKRLVTLDAAFDHEHKHLFNEFGINLRKNKMYSQAVQYYERAVQMSPDDENLMYNIARAYLEEKNIDKTIEYIHLCLQKNPDLESAQKLLQWLKDKGLYKAQSSSPQPKKA